MSAQKSRKKNKDVRDEIDIILDQYQKDLDSFDDSPSSLLSILVARDKIHATIEKSPIEKIDHVEKLINSDKQLKELLMNNSIENLSDWRNSLKEVSNAWWWNFEKEDFFWNGKNSIWFLITSTLFLLTSTLSVEIIRRFWEKSPDGVSVFASIIIVLITSSPLLKKGKEFSLYLLDELFSIKPKYQSQVIAAMALVSFLIILLGRVWGLQALAKFYNNDGFAQLQNGILVSAQQSFTRAASLNPDQVVPFQNIANVYIEIRLFDEAESSYKQAIKKDINFSPAYSGLGYLYNLKGEYVYAEAITLAGLNINSRIDDETMKIVTQYQLLSYLGWSYFAQGKHDLALDALVKAISVEPQLKEIGETNGVEYRIATPHFFLAQIYNLLEQPDNARAEWENCLRYLDNDNWKDQEWLQLTLSELK
jgi:tetratricopeptide (TPR) repeat protein